MRERASERARFVGPPARFRLDLVPGLLELIEVARGNRRDEKLPPAAQIQASRDALKAISDSALAYFHAVYFFASVGHPWAVALLAEFALSATSAVEATIAQRPREPMKPVPLWQSPEDAATNDAHTLRPDSDFAALLRVFRSERQMPVLIRRHAKAFNAKKLQLVDVVQLGSGLNEPIRKRRFPNPDKPLNRFLDRYLPIIQASAALQKGLPEPGTKAAARKWALRLLDVFEQNNGAAIEHRLFADVLKGGPKTAKGKRGAIRDAVQDALFRRYKPGAMKSS